MLTLQTYLVKFFSKLKRARSQKIKQRRDLYVLNLKSYYDVMLFMCQCYQQHFTEFFFWGVIFRLRDMQEYILMFSIALEWR